MDSLKLGFGHGRPTTTDTHPHVIAMHGDSTRSPRSLPLQKGSMEQLVPCLSALRRRLAGDTASVELLEKIEAGVLELSATLHSLLTFTSGRKPKLGWVNVRQIVDDVCASLQPQIQSQRVETSTDVPGHLGVVADREMLRSAILNLVSNALDAMPRGGRLVITSFIGCRGLELEVADSGPGLSEEVLDQVFEPFFTTKAEAAGLGLAIVNRIAEVHGGEVLAANCPEGGAAFTLRLPQGSRRAAA